MDEMKGKFKGFMKKVNYQLSSSSTSFKGQGRVLGNAQSTSSEPVNPPAQKTRTQLPSAPRNSDKEEAKPIPKEAPANPGQFDPFDSLITSSKTSKNGYSLNLFECPICGSAFGTEEEVSFHVNSCVDKDSSQDIELHDCVSVFLSGNPSDSSIEIVVKLLRNVAKEPDNAKFRRIRMGNPKIKEAIADPGGGIALIRFLGFELKEEDGETWAIMENPPSEKEVNLIDAVVNLLDANKMKKNKEEEKPTISLPQKIDRQIRVFFPIPESIASRIELPDSFYTLSANEIRREADARKKKLADSQLLIPKSMREKQARKRHLRSMIRIQFPDGVVLQGVFGSHESTTALYEFVSLALKNPNSEFELLDPVAVKRRMIPIKGKLEDEGLVPSALIKFRPVDCDSSPFTGVSDELLQIMEPFA